jgi:hypothetical protein
LKKRIVLCIMPVLALCVLAICMNCGSKGDGNPVSAGNNTTTITMPGTFRATADTIYLSMNTWLDTFRYCNGDSLVVQIDTISNPGETQVSYSISGSTLTYSLSTNTFMNDSGSWVIAQTAVFSRLGTGNGLQGTWILSSESYTVVSGSLPDSTRHMIDSTMSAARQSLSSGEFAAQITFSGNQFTETVTYKKDAGSQVDYFVSRWDSCSTFGMDTCDYAISVTKLNDNAAQLHGTKTNETVTIVWSPEGDMTYTSSDTSHHASVYYNNPTSCPDPYVPSWYYSFLSANSKSTVTLTKPRLQPVPVQRHALRALLRHCISR